jgi:hypothetical protein
MFEAIVDWFQSLGGNVFSLVIILGVIALLIWVSAEMRNRREEQRAEEAADAEWAAGVAARKRLPTALSIPDVVHVKHRKRAAPKRANKRKMARHK